MGTYSQIYFGPFLKVKNEQVPTIVKFNSCSQPACSKFNKEINSPFCPTCGAKQGTGQKTKNVDKINFFEFSESHHESLSQVFTPSYRVFNGFVYLVPNLSRNAPRKFFISNPSEFSVTTNLNETIEKQWLETAFATEIADLKKLAGNDAVEVHWGVITYAN